MKLWKPLGVQHDVDPDVLDTGWELHYEKPYTHATSRKDLRGIPAEARFVLVCAKLAEYRTITLCAIGERGAVVNERNDDMTLMGGREPIEARYTIAFDPETGEQKALEMHYAMDGAANAAAAIGKIVIYVRDLIGL